MLAAHFSRSSDEILEFIWPDGVYCRIVNTSLVYVEAVAVTPCYIKVQTIPFSSRSTTATPPCSPCFGVFDPRTKESLRSALGAAARTARFAFWNSLDCRCKKGSE